mgnify:CR=1 FL=1
MFKEAGLGTSVVCAMTIGIVVDDTVHILLAYRNGRRFKGLSSSDAMRYSYRHVGDAVISTSAILAAGFGVLAFSGFQPTFEMGILASITILCALIADLFILPFLVGLIDRDVNKPV